MDRLMRLFCIGLLSTFMLMLGTHDAFPSGIRPFPEMALSASETSRETIISSYWLETLFREEVLLASGWDPGMLEIRAMDPAQDIHVEKQPVSYQADPPDRVSPGRRAQIRVTLYDEDRRSIKRMWVSGILDLYQTVCVLNVPIRSGEILTTGHVSLQRRHVREIPPEAVTDPQRILGMQARRNLLAGAVLLRDQWEVVPLVRRGQQVRILLETALMRLVATGQSLADGGHGEQVRVLNLSSRQVVHAFVRDHQTVQVRF